jgi:uncharacterized protein
LKAFSISIIILFCGLFFLNSITSGEEIFHIKLGEEKLKVWIAETPAEITKGLSGVKKLEETDGMLFIFQEERVPSFWMKDMNFPIDIIWIDKNKKVVEVTSNILPETYPKTFSPKTLVKYVLEVEEGWSKKKMIKIGDKLFYE